MARPTKNYVVVNGQKYFKMKSTKPAKVKAVDGKGFQGKLNELKAFVNRKRNTQKILSITANGKTKDRPYTKKNGEQNVYTFQGATIHYADGSVKEKFYHDLGYMIKNEW